MANKQDNIINNQDVMNININLMVCQQNTLSYLD